jgi:predicted esterase
LKHSYWGAWILCAFLLGLPVWAEQITTKSSFYFVAQSRTYYSFIPASDGPLPVVVLLHGSGRNGGIMVDLWKDLAAREHFIVAALDAYDSAGWDIKMDPPSVLHAVVDQVEAKHAVDRNRIYLFGNSSGAEYALLLAILDSHYFAAIALHAGALPPGYNKLFSYAGRRLPVAIWVGDRDLLFPLDSVIATKKEFEANGFPIKLSVIPNHDHNYYEISDRINAAAWDFLKSAQLRPDSGASQK